MICEGTEELRIGPMEIADQQDQPQARLRATYKCRLASCQSTVDPRRSYGTSLSSRKESTTTSYSTPWRESWS
jgi:hypothetical protein